MLLVMTIILRYLPFDAYIQYLITVNAYFAIFKVSVRAAIVCYVAKYISNLKRC